MRFIKQGAARSNLRLFPLSLSAMFIATFRFFPVASRPVDRQDPLTHVFAAAADAADDDDNNAKSSPFEIKTAGAIKINW